MAKESGASILYVAIAIAMSLVGGVVVFFFDDVDTGVQQPTTTELSRAPQVASIEEDIAQKKNPLPTASSEILDDGGPELQASYLDNPAAEGAVQENPYFNREVKLRLAQVADVYAEQIKYPSFSMPITDQEALRKYLPNRSIGVEQLMDINDEHSPLIRLQTDKQHYFVGNVIRATVSLSGLVGSPRIEIGARLVTQGQTLAKAEISAVDRQTATYQMIFSDLNRLADSPVDEYRVVASISIDGKLYELGTPISYVASVAKVTGVGLSQVSGEYLYIPVNVFASKPGYHELSANLYTENGSKPLVHLSVQQELQSRSDLMQLKVHIAALKVGEDPGPYRLQDISFLRMPSPPDFTSEYGDTSQEYYSVNGYAFDEYDDQAYLDEEAEERLEFLRQVREVE
jgi:hypothetical protein